MTTRQAWWEGLFQDAGQFAPTQNINSLVTSTAMFANQAETDRSVRQFFQENPVSWQDFLTDKEKSIEQRQRAISVFGYDSSQFPEFIIVPNMETGELETIEANNAAVFNRIMNATMQRGNQETLFGSTGGYQRATGDLMTFMPAGMDLEEVIAGLPEDLKDKVRTASETPNALWTAFGDVFKGRIFTGQQRSLFNYADELSEALTFTQKGYNPEKFWEAVQADPKFAMAAELAGVTYDRIKHTKNALQASTIINTEINAYAIETALPYNSQLQAVLVNLPAMFIDDPDTALEVILTGTAAAAATATGVGAPAGIAAVSQFLARRTAQVYKIGSKSATLIRGSKRLSQGARYLNPFDLFGDTVVPTLSAVNQMRKGTKFSAGYKISKEAAQASKAANWKHFLVGAAAEGALSEFGAYFVNLNALTEAADTVYGEGNHQLGFRMGDLLTDMLAGGMFGIALGSSLRGVFSGAGAGVGLMARSIETGNWAKNLVPEVIKEGMQSYRRIMFHAEVEPIVEGYGINPEVTEKLNEIFFNKTEEDNVFDIQGDILAAVRRVRQNFKTLSVERLAEEIQAEIKFNREVLVNMGNNVEASRRRAENQLGIEIRRAKDAGDTARAEKLQKDLVTVQTNTNLTGDAALKAAAGQVVAQGNDMDLAPDVDKGLAEAPSSTNELMEKISKSQEERQAVLDAAKKAGETEPDKDLPDLTEKHRVKQLTDMEEVTFLKRVLTEAAKRAKRRQVSRTETVANLRANADEEGTVNLTQAIAVLPENRHSLREKALPNGRIHVDQLQAEVDRVFEADVTRLRQGHIQAEDVSFTVMALMEDPADLDLIYYMDMQSNVENIKKNFANLLAGKKISDTSLRSEAEMVEFNKKVKEARALPTRDDLEIDPDFTVFDWIQSRGARKATMDAQVFLHIASALHAISESNMSDTVTRVELVQAMPEGFEQIADILIESLGGNKDSIRIQDVVSQLAAVAKADKDLEVHFQGFLDWVMHAFNIVDAAEKPGTFRSKAITVADIMEQRQREVRIAARRMKNEELGLINQNQQKTPTATQVKVDLPPGVNLRGQELDVMAWFASDPEGDPLKQKMFRERIKRLTPETFAEGGWLQIVNSIKDESVIMSALPFADFLGRWFKAGHKTGPDVVEVYKLKKAAKQAQADAKVEPSDTTSVEIPNDPTKFKNARNETDWLRQVEEDVMGVVLKNPRQFGIDLHKIDAIKLKLKEGETLAGFIIRSFEEDTGISFANLGNAEVDYLKPETAGIALIQQFFGLPEGHITRFDANRTETDNQGNVINSKRPVGTLAINEAAPTTTRKELETYEEYVLNNRQAGILFELNADGTIKKYPNGQPVVRQFTDEQMDVIEAWIKMDPEKEPKDMTDLERAGVALMGKKEPAEIQVRRSVNSFHLIPTRHIGDTREEIPDYDAQLANATNDLMNLPPAVTVTVHDQYVVGPLDALLLGSVTPVSQLNVGGSLRADSNVASSTAGMNSLNVPEGSLMDLFNRNLEVLMPNVMGISQMARKAFEDVRTKGVMEAVKPLFGDTLDTPEAKRSYELALSEAKSLYEAGAIDGPDAPSRQFETAVFMHFVLNHSEVDASASGPSIARALHSVFSDELGRAKKAGGDDEGLAWFNGLKSFDPNETDLYTSVVNHIRTRLEEDGSEFNKTQEQIELEWWMDNVLEPVDRDFAKKPVLVMGYNGRRPAVTKNIQEYLEKNFPELTREEINSKVQFMADRVLHVEGGKVMNLIAEGLGTDSKQISKLLHEPNTVFVPLTGGRSQPVSPEQLLRDPDVTPSSVMAPILYSLGIDPENSVIGAHMSVIVQVARHGMNVARHVNSQPALAQAAAEAFGLKVNKKTGMIAEGDVIKQMVKGLSEVFERSRRPDGTIDTNYLKKNIAELNKKSISVQGGNAVRRVAVRGDEGRTQAVLSQIGFDSVEALSPLARYSLMEAVFSQVNTAAEGRLFHEFQGSAATRIADTKDRLDPNDPEADLGAVEKPVSIYNIDSSPLEGMAPEESTRLIRQRTIQDSLLRASHNFSFGRLTEADPVRVDPTPGDLMQHTLNNEKINKKRKVTKAKVAETRNQMVALQEKIAGLKERNAPRVEITAAEREFSTLEAAYKSFLKNNENTNENLSDNYQFQPDNENPKLHNDSEGMLSFGRQDEGINRMIPASERKTFRELFGIPALRRWGLTRSQFGSVLRTPNAIVELNADTVSVPSSLKSSGQFTGLLTNMISFSGRQLPSKEERSFQIQRAVLLSLRAEPNAYLREAVEKKEWGKAFLFVLRKEQMRRYHRKAVKRIDNARKRRGANNPNYGYEVYDILAETRDQQEREWNVLVRGFGRDAQDRVSPIGEIDPMQAMDEVSTGNTWDDAWFNTGKSERSNAVATALLNHVMPDADLTGNRIILGENRMDSKVVSGRNPILTFHMDSFQIYFSLSQFDQAIQGAFQAALNEEKLLPNSFAGGRFKTWKEWNDANEMPAGEMALIYMRHTMATEGKVDYTKAMAAWWARETGNMSEAEALLNMSGATVHVIDDRKALLDPDNDQADAIIALTEGVVEFSDDGVAQNSRQLAAFVDEEKPLYGRGVQAFISGLGNVVRANTTKGNVRVTLTRDQKIMALNQTQNRDIVDAIQVARILNIKRMAMDNSMSSRVSKYDPDHTVDRLGGQRMSPYHLKAHLRDQANLDAQAIGMLDPNVERQADMFYRDRETGEVHQYLAISDRLQNEIDDAVHLLDASQYTGVELDGTLPAHRMAAELFNLGVPVNQIVGATALLTRDAELIRFANNYRVYTREDLTRVINGADNLSDQDRVTLGKLANLVNSDDKHIGIRQMLGKMYEGLDNRYERIKEGIMGSMDSIMDLKTPTEIYIYLRDQTEGQIPTSSRWDLAYELNREVQHRNMVKNNNNRVMATRSQQFAELRRTASIYEESEVAVVDVEADGLFEPKEGQSTITQVHGIAVKSMGSGEIRIYTNNPDLSEGELPMSQFFEDIKNFKAIVGHNFNDYDLRAINKYAGREEDTIPDDIEIIDTLHLARNLFPDGVEGRDNKLDTWGTLVGSPKGTPPTDWSQWTPEMRAYLKQDVGTSEAVFRYMQRNDTDGVNRDVVSRVVAVRELQPDNTDIPEDVDVDPTTEMMDVTPNPAFVPTPGLAERSDVPPDRSSVVLLTRDTVLRIDPEERKNVVYLGDEQSRKDLKLGDIGNDLLNDFEDILESMPTLAEAARTAAFVITDDVSVASYSASLDTGVARHAGVVIIPRSVTRSKGAFRQAVVHELLHHLTTKFLHENQDGKFVQGLLEVWKQRAATGLEPDADPRLAGILELINKDGNTMRGVYETVTMALEDSLLSGEPTPLLDDLLALGLGSAIGSHVKEFRQTVGANNIMDALQGLVANKETGPDMLSFRIESPTDITLFNSRVATQGIEAEIEAKMKMLEAMDAEIKSGNYTGDKLNTMRNDYARHLYEYESMMDRNMVGPKEAIQARIAKFQDEDGFLDAENMRSSGRSVLGLRVQQKLEEIAQTDSLYTGPWHRLIDEMQSFTTGTADLRNSEFSQLRALAYLLNPNQNFTAMRVGEFAGIPTLEGLRNTMNGRTGMVLSTFSTAAKAVQKSNYTVADLESTVFSLLQDPNLEDSLDAELVAMAQPVVSSYGRLLRITAKEAVDEGIMTPEAGKFLEKGMLPPKLTLKAKTDTAQNSAVQRAIGEILERNMSRLPNVSKHVMLGSMFNGRLHDVRLDNRYADDMVDMPQLQRYLEIAGRASSEPTSRASLIVKLADDVANGRLTKNHLDDYGLRAEYEDSIKSVVSGRYFDSLRKDYGIQTEKSDEFTGLDMHRLMIMKTLNEDTFFSSDPFFTQADFDNPKLSAYVDKSILSGVSRIRRGFGHLAMERALVRKVFQIRNMDFGNLISMLTDTMVEQATVDLVENGNLVTKVLDPRQQQKLHKILEEVVRPHRDFARHVIPQLDERQAFRKVSAFLDPILRYMSYPFWTTASIVVEGSMTTMKMMNRAMFDLQAELHTTFEGLSKASQEELLSQLGMYSYFLGAEMDNLQFGGDIFELDVLQEMFSGAKEPAAQKLGKMLLNSSRMGFNMSQKIMRAAEARSAQERAIKSIPRMTRLAKDLRPMMATNKLKKADIFEVARKHGFRRAELRELQEWIDSGMMDPERLLALDRIWRSASNDGQEVFNFEKAYEMSVMGNGPDAELAQDTLISFRHLLYNLTTDTNLEMTTGDFAVKANHHGLRLILRLTTYVTLFARRMRTFLLAAPATVIMQYLMGIWFLENTYTSLSRIARGSTAQAELARFTSFNENPVDTTMAWIESGMRLPIAGVGGAMFLQTGTRMIMGMIPGVNTSTNASLGGAPFVGVTSAVGSIRAMNTIGYNFFTDQETDPKDYSRAANGILPGIGVAGVAARVIGNQLLLEDAAMNEPRRQQQRRTVNRVDPWAPMPRAMWYQRFVAPASPAILRALREANPYEMPEGMNNQTTRDRSEEDQEE